MRSFGSVFFGEGTKSWSISGPSNKEWYTPDIPTYDYNLAESKRLLASLGYKDGNGDGIIEDPRGNPVTFQLKTNADNTMRVAAGELHSGRSREGRHPRHPLADRLQLADYESAKRPSVRGDPAGFAERGAAGSRRTRRTCCDRRASRTTSSSSSRSPRRRKKHVSINSSTSW